MRSILVAITTMCLFASVVASADQTQKNIFKGSIGEESYQGYLDGQCGIWQKDFNKMLEIEDTNGLSRELFTSKIDSFEIKPIKDKKSQVIISIGEKTIRGIFPCMTYLITDTGRIDLLSSKINKNIKFVRVK